MKQLKMLGLAVAAATALMAFGAGSASATELCTSGATPCTGMYPAGTVIKAALGAGQHSTLEAFFANVTCKNSTVEGTTSNTGSSTVTVGVKITSLTFTECNEGACTITIPEKGELEIHTDPASPDGNGILTGIGQIFTADCNGVRCYFGTAAGGTELGTLTGKNPATLVVAAKLMYITGHASTFVCTLGSGFGYWTAHYNITAPKPLFVL